ncbi:hypothetical protein KDA00_04155 [Candidatus Saccharibacteria bacterium]|nr:hypothetical protein [Candidatus Saccharibacteria bacterium]
MSTPEHWSPKMELEISGLEPPIGKIIVDFDEFSSLGRSVAEHYGRQFDGDLFITFGPHDLSQACEASRLESRALLRSQEQAVTNAGYTDSEWLEEWRVMTNKHNVTNTLPRQVRNRVFGNLVRDVVPSVVEAEYKKLRKADFIKIFGLGVVATSGLITLSDGVSSPIEAILPFTNTYLLYSWLRPTTSGSSRMDIASSKVAEEVRVRNPQVSRHLERAIRVIPKFEDS